MVSLLGNQSPESYSTPKNQRGFSIPIARSSFLARLLLPLADPDTALRGTIKWLCAVEGRPRRIWYYRALSSSVGVECWGS
jgi:hypothetical protein